MHQVDGMTHPLVGNSAGKFLVEPEFKIQLRIKWPRRFGEQPLTPIRVLLADLLHLRAPTPAWSMIVPHNFHFADVSESAAPSQLLRGPLIRLTAMLSSDLHDRPCLNHRITPSLGFRQHIAHRLLDVGLLTYLGRHF